MFEYCNCFVVKVTRDCNLRCKYCYVADKDKYKGEVMSFDVFKALVDRICLDKTKTDRPYDFSFIFHGGEPTIIGYDNLNKFLHYAYHKFTEYDLPFRFGIQTNATLLTDDILQLFHDFKIDPGVSFDGGYSKSNSSRTTKNVNFYTELFKKCRKYGITPGTLGVISAANINYTRKNIKFLQKKLKVNNSKLNYAEDTFGVGGCEVPGKEFCQKLSIPLLESFPDKFKRKTPFIENNLEHILSSYFRNIFEMPLGYTLDSRNQSGNCGVKFCGSGNKVLEISPDGSINYCGRYQRDDEVSKVFTIFDNDFLDTQTRKMVYKRMAEKHKVILEHHCDLCMAADICDYGCMAFYYARFGKFGIREDLVCDYFKTLKRYILEHEGELFDKWFVLKAGSHSEFYCSCHRPITEHDCHEIMRLIPHSNKYQYSVVLDPKWKGPKDQIRQVLIRRSKRKKNWFSFFKRKKQQKNC